LTRADAYALLTEYTENANLVKHALAVEAAMRTYARKFGEDEELWGIVGLLHDFDYERYPNLEEHPFRGVQILRQRGYPETVIRGVLAHAPHTGQPRDTLMEKTIFAVDELCGFLVACALVRPGKSIMGMEVKSVKKKLKDKAFARNVRREDIYQGAEELGVDLNEHLATCIQALEGIAGELGLDGSAA